MEVHNFLLQLVLILFSARFLGECLARFNVPSVIGELLAGVILGPSLLNIVEPNEMIKLLAEIGIILLLFEVGIETDIGRLAKTGYRPFVVAIGGVVIPLALGFAVSYYFFELSLLISLFIGSTLTATSIGITLRVLSDLKRQSSDEAQIVLGAAVLDDIVGIILLSVLYEFASKGSVSIMNIGSVLAFICLFLLVAPIAAKLVSSIIRYYEKKSQIPGLLPTMIVSLLLFFAWLAHLVGAPELLGGFAAGLALSKHFSLPFGSLFQVDDHFSDKVEKHMRSIVHLFTPIFFVAIGLSLNFAEFNWSSPSLLLFTGAILAVAVFGKLASGFLLFKDSTWIQWAVGIAMIPRGEVGLIFAEIGRERGVLDNDLYTSLVLVIAITTIFTPFAMRVFFSRNKEKAHA